MRQSKQRSSCGVEFGQPSSFKVWAPMVIEQAETGEQVEEALELGMLARRLRALKMLVSGTPATPNCL